MIRCPRRCQRTPALDLAECRTLEQLIADCERRAAKCDKMAKVLFRFNFRRSRLLTQAAVRHRNDRTSFVIELRQARHRMGEPLTMNGHLRANESDG